MTAKELIKELRKIIRANKGKDYRIRIWNGANDMHDLCFIHLVDSETLPDLDHIALNTEKAVLDLTAMGAGLDLTKHTLS